MSGSAKINTSSGSQAFSGFDLLLFATTVFAWSFSWYALAVQPGVVANEVSLVYRFGSAVILMFLWVIISGRQWSFAAKHHLGFALLGLCLFSNNFLLFYYASQYLVSGILAVIFATASIVNVLFAAIIARKAPPVKILFAGVLGVFGVVFLSWPEVQKSDGDWQVVLGIVLSLCGTMFFCCGNLVSGRLQRVQPRIPLVSMNAWGMFYGTVWLTFLAVLQGKPFNWDYRIEYAASMVWLSVISTVIAFAAYLTLLGRVGSGRSGYATVMFPVGALLLSTFVESYTWSLMSLTGLAMVLLGNLIIIRG
ncbi:MAG: DMT family transporter [Alphaproteobacteria bacterium]